MGTTDSWVMVVPPQTHFYPGEQTAVLVAVVREERSGRCALALEWCQKTPVSRKAAEFRLGEFLAKKGIPSSPMHKEATA